MKRYPLRIKEDIYKDFQNGSSVWELHRKYGISRYAIQCWCGLRPEKEKAIPKRQVRPPKDRMLSEKEKDKEIQRLKMENELLRSFLQIAGRR